ncbi:MAG: EAL domain-containing protein, partial [Mycobacteriales bacterium]
MPDELDLALAGLTAVYQPVVHLETRDVLGYEALARGAAGSPLEQPQALLAAAREAGRTAEVDWRCRDAALGGALAAGLGSTLTVFVNIEPDTDAAVPAAYRDRIAAAEDGLRVVIEVT